MVDSTFHVTLSSCCFSPTAHVLRTPPSRLLTKERASGHVCVVPHLHREHDENARKKRKWWQQLSLHMQAHTMPPRGAGYNLCNHHCLNRFRMTMRHKQSCYRTPEARQHPRVALELHSAAALKSRSLTAAGSAVRTSPLGSLTT
jgi:hypothetical protein